MSEMLTWPQIKERYPELAARLRDGDLSARAEFVRLSFGAEIIEVRHRDGSVEKFKHN